MFKKQILLISSFMASTFFKSYCQDGIIGKINYEDTVIGKIDSITTFIHNPDSKFAYAMDYDATMPEGKYALYLVDTVKGELRKATVYTYEGKIKKLTNYYFLEKKLIKVTDARVPKKNQESNKFDTYTRTYYYNNDTLKYFINDTKENFNYKTDLLDAQNILKRFQIKFSSGELNFKKI